MLMKKCVVVFTLLTSVLAIENIYTTKVFTLTIDPSSFNWTLGSHSQNGYWFRPSLANCPDLPKWLSYTYSKRYKVGFLYGVPPSEPQNYQIEVVGMNRDTFETQTQTIDLKIVEKPDPAKYEVHLKIDNLNVEDMIDPDRLTNLMKVITKVLWPQSEEDLYVTFLASAVELGARLPLSPTESDGVVVRLGSRAEFSDNLHDLQEEVKPLWKLHSCPRDFKRSTVDRHFRPFGFVLDWCSFRLGKHVSEGNNALFPHTEPSGEGDWQLPSKLLLPSRSYSSDLIATLVLPLTVLVLLAFLLSLILCFHHEGINKHVEENEATLTQYEAVQRATNSLRSMSNMRDTETSPRMVADTQDGTRPHPPPYGATRRIVHPDS